MVERIWLKQYPKGIPADIDVSQYDSLLDLIDECVRDNSVEPCQYHLGTTLSFEQFDILSKQFAAYLQHELKLNSGERVAVMMPNCLAFPVAITGILRAGCIATNINPMYTDDELEYQLNDTSAKCIIILENFSSTLESIIDNTAVKHVLISRIGDLHDNPKRWLINLYSRYFSPGQPAKSLDSIDFHQTVMSSKDNTYRPVELSKQEIAFLQYTGGTTGVAKGAMLTHGNLLANITQAYTWVKPVFDNRNINHPHIITALPLYHIFALTANFFVVMKLGGCGHLITNPRDIKRFIGELSKVKFHCIIAVNTLFNALLHHKDFAKLDFSPLCLSLGGGMSVQSATAEAWQKLTDCPILEAYGLTESSPALCINPVTNKRYTGSIGLPLPSTEISIRNDDGGQIPTGEAGELWARGPQIMQGYWTRPEETAQTITEDGWLKTGDIAVMEADGYLRIVDRKKDMIIISGFNVYPNEIEDVLTRHPHIDEAGVVGIADERSGEIIKAIVVKNHPPLSADDVIAHCREYLTAYKIPKIIEFRRELPKSSVGKILRRSLRQDEK